ncbi:HNH endonuclease signature motif containing protein [Corynebacterium frankenforstense]|uniref:HNH endonuclease signature motif containing protein n=1 Tax=Corynebacterium frankenforstense TaxID=1230998 RepID=UPI000951904B|nr:HNH endonuclease signature motif containing protein [Corynebacterium frankenforstense]
MTTATALNPDGPDSARVREVNSLIGRISSDMEKVSELIDTSVKAREFQDMLPSLVNLEKAMGSKTVIDHTVAHLAGVHHAGNLTGTSRVDLFLAEVFDLSRAEARARVDGAENTYGPARPAAAPDPTPAPEPDTDAGDGTGLGNGADSGTGSVPGADAGAASGSGADGVGADSGAGRVPGAGEDLGPDGAPGDGDDWSSEAPGSGPADEAESERERAEREREKRERAEREREERRRQEQERLEREKAERRAAEERRRQAEGDRREANRRAREKKLAAEKLRIINNELKNLLDEAKVGAEELRRRAIEEADNRSPEDLRDWIRNRVAEANLESGDPLAAFKKRWLWVSKQQADGGVHIKGYLPASTAALLKHLMAGATPGFDRPKDDDADADILELGIPGLDPDGVAASRAKRNGPDRRRRAERYADLLHHVLSAYAAGKTEDTGNAAIVLSLVADDADEIMQAGADVETDPAKARRAFMRRHPTNTGIDLSLFELMKIKAKPYDYLVLHDTAGNPLYAGRARRLGNFMQKVALFAAEGVCSYPGCTAPADLVELHHDWPHSDGGPTDINNLTFRCKEHHRDNNDKRDMQASRGWSARDPETGRMGHTPPAASSDTSGVTINRTQRADFSAGERIRRKYEHLDSESGNDTTHPTDGSGAPAAGRDPNGAGVPRGGARSDGSSVLQDGAGPDGSSVPQDGGGFDGTGVPADPDESWMADYEDYLAEKYSEESEDAGGPGSGAAAGHPAGAGFDEPEDTHYAAPLNFDDGDGGGEDWPGDEPTLFSA